MENTTPLLLSVSDFIALTNQTLEYAFLSVAIEGEVSGFKVNQNKYVFFDIKDATGSVNCFMTVWQLRQPIENGMKIIVRGTPKLTDWGKFSLTVQTIQLSGEGSLKRSFELLEKKLEGEGLFSTHRKRILPYMPQHIAVVSSIGAAGYADFMKIIDDRWGGLSIDVAQVQVQGREAPDQIVRAIRYFNTLDELPEVIVLIRGGGSLDDLSAFNDEVLVREIAASRIPILVGVGHESDVTLADKAADVRAATPSNAAQLIVPDKNEIIRSVQQQMKSVGNAAQRRIEYEQERVASQLQEALEILLRRHTLVEDQLLLKRRLLAELDPYKVLQRGYAIIRGALSQGERIEIETSTQKAKVEVLYVESKI